MEKIYQDVTNNLLQIAGDNVVMISLYGSYARGEQRSDSDIDIALILDNELSKETKHQLDRVLCNLDMTYNICRKGNEGDNQCAPAKGRYPRIRRHD